MRQSLAHGRSVDNLDVVLVDEHRGSQAILRSMIGTIRVGRLRVYERPEEALKDMTIDPPHLVITEWDMKRLSGHRFTQALRAPAMAPLCFAPIIVVSANVTMSMIDRAFSAGANAVLVKPISTQTLHRRLEWATRDERGFVRDGDGYAVAGMERILETRVRPRRGGSAAPHHGSEEAPPAAGPDAQPEPATGRGDGREDHAPPPEPDEPAPPPRGSDTWKSWTVT